MSDEDAVAASVKRISTDTERLTRRNMKECVAEHIQSLCKKDTAFARRTMHPRKNMICCFKYINCMARNYVKQEMEDNDIGDNKKLVKRDKSEWSVIENVVPAIISKELFEKANSMLVDIQGTGKNQRASICSIVRIVGEN